MSELREKPAGTIRITAAEYATDTILLPRLSKLLRNYPDIKVEIVIDYGLTDIVAQHLDASLSPTGGVRRLCRRHSSSPWLSRSAGSYVFSQAAIFRSAPCRHRS